MKRPLFLWIALFISSISVGQFTANCSTDFWTTSATGQIQQWNLMNNSVSGGDTIVEGSGNSLSFCGIALPTFYSVNYNPLAIDVYEQGTGWISDTVQYFLDNSGCHLGDHYFMSEGGFVQFLMHWDGVNLSTVDSLHTQGKFFAGISDIAVDTLGQAWFTVGPQPGFPQELLVYDQSGLVNSYTLSTQLLGYGSFFLEGTLYFGANDGNIYPVVINGSMAQLGMAIPFPIQNFTDMASCQGTGIVNTVQELNRDDILLFPNPTKGPVHLPFELQASVVQIYNSLGQRIPFHLSGNQIDLSEQGAGVYLIQLRTRAHFRTIKVLLEK